MKTFKKLFFVAILSSLLACSGNNNESKDSSDSLTTPSDTSAKADTTAKVSVAPVEVKDPAEDLNLVFKDIITTMKAQGDLSKLNKYIDPKTGMYHVYTVGDFNRSYDKYDKLEQIDGDEANGPGPDSYANFRDQLAKIDTAKLSLNYDLTKADECKMKKKGTFAITIEKPITLLSDCYNQLLQVTGEDPDNKQAARLKKAESKITQKIIINLFDNSNANGAEVFYFSCIDKKWYLQAIDLTDCGGDNE